MFYNKIILPVNDFEMSSSLRPCLENSYFFQFHFTCPRIEPGISTCDVCLDIGAAYAELATTRRFTFPSLAAVVSCYRTLVLSSKCSVSSNKSLSECGSVGVCFCNMHGQYKCVDWLWTGAHWLTTNHPQVPSIHIHILTLQL